MSNVTEYDMYLFGEGTHYDIYEKMGAHVAEVDGVKGVYFDVWAPHAEAVYVIGDFNGWDEEKNPLTRLEPEGIGIFEAFVPEAQEGNLYKYLIHTAKGDKLYKADPFASMAEVRPGTASRIAVTDGFTWTDSKWMKKRKAAEAYYEQPMAIYEIGRAHV